MRKEETLQKIKAAEGQVRVTKETVLAERDRILRDARREAFELREDLRRKAESRFAEILQEAEAVTARETERILAVGRSDADSVKAEAEANLERAIDRLIEKFKGALNA
jgi:V/A-type H+/Na+-transporting ATPase subunit G/H